MKILKYQQDAVEELTNKTISLLNLKEHRKSLVFKAPTGAGKTIMACNALASIIDELKNRPDNYYQEAAFIWIAPRKLHLQSYSSLKGIFSETRKLRPVMFDELEQNEGIQPGEILFVNWESITKKNNLMVKDSESNVSLYEITRRTQEDFNLPIITIIDEEHMFWTKTADKSAEVLDRINSAVEIRISATPKTKTDNIVVVHRKDVVEAEMIKKEVVLNPGIDLDFRDDRTLNQNLLQSALNKRNEIAEAYKSLGTKINPLLLIQLPNDSREDLTAEEEAIVAQVKVYLNEMCNINEDNGRLAVWLSKEKSNLSNLESPDNITQVLLFKEAIALGWDCPRAAVLLIFRKLKSEQFTIQTVGRILRMPEQKHYPNEMLNTGFVYTDIAKDQISIVAEDANYIFKNSFVSHRRKNLSNVELPSYYSERPNLDRNYLGPDFKQTLYEEAERYWSLDYSPSLFTLEELASLVDEEYSTLPDTDDTTINENRKKVETGIHAIRLDVKTINVQIPKNVHFQNEEQVLKVDQIRFARKASELDRVFMAYISSKGTQFESKGRADKISSYLLEMMADFFGVYDMDTKKIVLYHDNKPHFDKLLDNALDAYAKKRNLKRTASQKSRQFKGYLWQVPEERIYESETHHLLTDVNNHAMMPYIQLNAASSPEKSFEKFLEENLQYIDWWYKNGDQGKQHYAIPYLADGKRSLFYVDFIIKMKNGHIYLFDTKSSNSDLFAADKHNALLDYIKLNSSAERPLFGGVILQDGNRNWVYSQLPIENTTDLNGWDLFIPTNA